MVCASPENVHRMLAQIDPRNPMAVRDRSAVVTLYNTGLRVAELAGLNHFDVWAEGCVRTVLFLRSSIAKGGYSREIPLNAPAREALEAVIRFNQRHGFSTAPDAPLFITKRHRRVTTRALQYVVSDLRERAQLAAPITPHSMRHGFASRVAETTGNVAIVAKLLGHRRLDTSGIYVHSSIRELTRAVDRLCEEVAP